MDPPGIVLVWKKLQPAAREGLMIFGALLFVISLVFMWAAFIRKPGRRRRHHRHHHHHPAPASKQGAKSNGEDHLLAERRKHRRRRRAHRPRNPTLAETGGLPPIKTDEETNPLS